MFKLAKPFFIQVITPLHAGSGSDLGVVDLPIQRERHTSFPKIEGSGLKGSIREAFEESQKAIQVGKESLVNVSNKSIISLVFGPEDKDKVEDHAGALGFTDARLLLFPVKSMKGVFAYITCPAVLKRFKADLELCSDSFNGNIPEPANENCIAANKNYIAIPNQNSVVLEEYAFEIAKEDKDTASKLAAKTGISDINNKLVILSDDNFKDFVNLSTEVITRTKIDNNTGTVQAGALFTEEYLPAETVMYSLALTTPIFKKKDEDKSVFKQNGKKDEEASLVMEYFQNGIPEVMQIGGNATIGKGIVKILWLEAKKDGGK